MTVGAVVPPPGALSVGLGPPLQISGPGKGCRAAQISKPHNVTRHPSPQGLSVSCGLSTSWILEAGGALVVNVFFVVHLDLTESTS